MDKSPENDEDNKKAQETTSPGGLLTPRNNLVKIRGLRKMSQEEMAEFLEVAISTYKNWEAGKTFPHEATRERVEVKLGLSKEEIWPHLKEEPEKQQKPESPTVTEDAIASEDEQNQHPMHVVPSGSAPDPKIIEEPALLSIQQDRSILTRRNFLLWLTGAAIVGSASYAGYRFIQQLTTHTSPTPSVPRPISIGSWQTVQSMARPRLLFSATTLKNGMVLVAGGLSTPTVLIDITEIFNYKENTWRQTKGLLNQPRVITPSALVALKSGQALLTTGTDADVQHDFATTELFDLQSDAWRVVAGLQTPRRSAAIALLNDGYHVLVIGGAHGPTNANQFEGSAELYDLIQNQWMYAGNLSVARQNAIAVTLKNGQVMVAGGEGPECDFGPAVDLYTPPPKNSWSPGQSLNRGLTGGTMTVLTDKPCLVSWRRAR